MSLSADELLNNPNFGKILEPYLDSFIQEGVSCVEFCKKQGIKKVIIPSLGGMPLMLLLNLIKKFKKIKDKELRFYVIKTSGYLDGEMEKSIREILITLLSEYKEEENKDELRVGFVDERVSGASIKKEKAVFREQFKVASKVINEKGLRLPKRLIIVIFAFFDISRYIKIKKINKKIDEVKQEFLKEKIERINNFDKNVYKTEVHQYKELGTTLYFYNINLPVISLFTEDIYLFGGLRYFHTYIFKDKEKEKEILVWEENNKVSSYPELSQEYQIIKKDNKFYIINNNTRTTMRLRKVNYPILLPLKGKEEIFFKKFKKLLEERIKKFLK